MEAGAATAGASAAACVSVQVQRGRIRARALANHPNRRHGHKAPKSRIPKPKRRNRDVGSFACVRSTARPCGKRMRWLHLRIRMRSTARHALGVSPRRDLTATMSRARRAWRAQWARDTVSAGAHGDHVTHKQWLVTKVAPFAFARACHAVLRAPRLLQRACHYPRAESSAKDCRKRARNSEYVTPAQIKLTIRRRRGKRMFQQRAAGHESEAQQGLALKRLPALPSRRGSHKGHTRHLFALAHQARPAQVLKSLQNVPERGVAQEGALRAGAIIALQGHLHTHGR
jgi:hypothetical protein